MQTRYRHHKVNIIKAKAKAKAIVPFEACTLRRVPPEIRALIFGHVRSHGTKGQFHLKHLATAVCGDKELLNEVSDILYRNIHVAVHPSQRGFRLGDRVLFKDVIEDIETLDIIYRWRQYRIRNYGTWPLPYFPRVLQSTKTVKHIHIDTRGDSARFRDVSNVLDLLAPKFDGINKLSVTYSTDDTDHDPLIFERLDAGLGVKRTKMQDVDDVVTFSWEAEGRSNLVMDNEGAKAVK